MFYDSLGTRFAISFEILVLGLNSLGTNFEASVLIFNNLSDEEIVLLKFPICFLFVWCIIITVPMIDQTLFRIFISL